jgi:mono/diheme cytochrome c family protein
MWRVQLLLAFLLLPATLRAAGASADAVHFETDVRPILKANCWHCHGESDELAGSLDARLARWILRGGDSGPAIVAGNHAESLLYQRVAAGEMPPGEKKLSAAQIDVLARWIDGGARTLRVEPTEIASGEAFSDEERNHWSFQPIRRPDVPGVRKSELVRSPIDAFLLARLEAEGLSFAPEADRATLIRRLTFDLTGLPPSPAAVDDFVNDPASDAYERLVDELLASPAYGERWGRHWLDVVGYADSDGYSERDAP